jgi:hypothetical protein
VIENAANLLHAPLASSNLVALDPRGVAGNPVMVTSMLGGLLSPDYIYHDSLYGSEAWDEHISKTFHGIS